MNQDRILGRSFREEAGEGEGGQTVEELTALLATANKDNAAMKLKNDELLGETKAAKNARRDAESTAEAERIRLATEKGDHEQLHKSAMEKNASLQSQLDEMGLGIATEKRNNAAMKVATELADGSNADLLSEFISKRLKWAEGGLKVTDGQGGLTVSSLEDLKTEFKNDARYSALLKGNQSSGGGATGGDQGGSAAKTMTRADFESLNPIAARKFMQAGGTLT